MVSLQLEFVWELWEKRNGRCQERRNDNRMRGIKRFYLNLVCEFKINKKLKKWRVYGEFKIIFYILITLKSFNLEEFIKKRFSRLNNNP